MKFEPKNDSTHLGTAAKNILEMQSHGFASITIVQTGEVEQYLALHAAFYLYNSVRITLHNHA